jgi:hypothetical protein
MKKAEKAERVFPDVNSDLPCIIRAYQFLKI